MTNEPIGTNGYIPPEIYLNNDYSYKVDIWSLGIILYLLTTEGFLPFDDENMDYESHWEESSFFTTRIS